MKRLLRSMVATSVCAVSPRSNNPIVCSLCGSSRQEFDEFVENWSTETTISNSSYLPQLSDDFLRGSGVKRPKSAARSSLYGAYAAKALLRNIEDSERGGLGIITISTTSSAVIAARYESLAFKDGWNMVDPFLLPNSIPTALATHVASAVGGHRFAVSLIDGAAALYTALEMMWLGANAGTDHVLVLAAEEANPELLEAAQLNGCQMREGAVGILFSAVGTRAGWRLTDVESLSTPSHHGENDSAYNSVSGYITLGTSFESILSLIKSLNCDELRMKHSFNVDGYGKYTSIWERTECK